MRVISKRPLREFWDIHPEAKQPILDWYRKAENASPDSFPELRKVFSSADYVDGYTIFDVGENRYRIIAVIHYDQRRLYVRNVLTHAEYDRNAWRRK